MRFIKVILFCAFGGIGNLALGSDIYVNGYTKSNGTYVEPHMRSAPDSNPYNNYSTKGNVNPYTGKEGTVEPYNSGNTNGYGRGYKPRY